MYGENQEDMNIFNTETRTDPTILEKKEFKFKLQNELYISESLIAKLIKEKDELLKELPKCGDTEREHSHPLFESRLECLHSELQQAHEVKRDIEKQLNILE
ncbi:unnamed protein product [Trichobilharzia szidati]|nr:unnamed protein product [Trichobilharzia szidati]